MNYEIEDLEWSIEQIFKEFNIKYKRFAPLEYDFWIAPDAPHASLISIEHPRKRITVLLVIHEINNECPPLKGTAHIRPEVTHFHPESKFCFYHLGGNYPTTKHLKREIRYILKYAILKERRIIKHAIHNHS